MVPILVSFTVVPEHDARSPVTLNESRHLPRFLNFGNPSLRPFRWPFLDLMKSVSARSRFRKASWYAHLEFSAHQASAGSAFFPCSTAGAVLPPNTSGPR